GGVADYRSRLEDRSNRNVITAGDDLGRPVRVEAVQLPEIAAQNLRAWYIDEGVIVQRTGGAGTFVVEEEEQLLVVASGKFRDQHGAGQVAAELIESQFRPALPLPVAEEGAC